MTTSSTAPLATAWWRTDTLTFLSFAIGMLIESYAFGVAAIATGWVHMPKSLDAIMLAWAPLWLIVGIAVWGPLSDRLGRRRTFYATMALYALGAVGLVFSAQYTLILTFLTIMLIAAGGEMNTIMITSHEIMPAAHRGKATMAAVNFVPLGGLLLALAAFSSSYESIPVQRAVVGCVALVVLGILFAIRQRTPESLRWLLRRGEAARAEAEATHFYGSQGARRLAEVRDDLPKIEAGTPQFSAGDFFRRPDTWVKLFSSLCMAFAGAAGFGLMTYVVGPYFFKHLTDEIILITEVAAFLSGFIFIFADRYSRRAFLLLGNGGALLVTLWILFAQAQWTQELIDFWLLLALLNVFVNIGYISEDTLKGEIWPTQIRGSMTALVRFVSIGCYILSIYLTEDLSLHQYILFNIAVWAIGATGAVVWFLFGVETGAGQALGVASGERRHS